MRHEQFTWHKSSYSPDNHGECVEVGWHKSSYSVDRNGDCVEAGPRLDGSPVFALRDSKHPERGHLTLPRSEWLAFLRDVKTDTA